ncbi:MAG: DUF2214 family protein [Psychromonas sp.]|nr:DUF2214 family protein [Alteromonadales bacterium]MCP5077069.1 DUF2214 family protein [Psychromonas sp.]
MLEIFIRYAHYLAMALLISTLFTQQWLLTKQVSNQLIKKLLTVDIIYSISAATALLSGLLLWLYVGKPSEFYSNNWIFQLKISLFILVGILSIAPTIFFFRHRKSTSLTITLPTYVIYVIRLEFALLFCLPLLAILMSRAYGLIL